MKLIKHLAPILIIVLVGMSISATNYAASTTDKSTGYSHEGSALISNIRVIDGLGHAPVDAQDILVVAGSIAAIGNTGTIDAPDGVLTIDGAGMTAIDRKSVV